jgi:hypothetical protein
MTLIERECRAAWRDAEKEYRYWLGVTRAATNPLWAGSQCAMTNDSMEAWKRRMADVFAGEPRRD